MSRSSEGFPGICLASASDIRRQLLEAAGLEFEVDPAEIDESVHVDENDPAGTARTLALEKAFTVSRRRPGEIVLGADQVFTLEGRFMPKPGDREGVVERLTAMSGRTHVFHCGVALVRDGVSLFDVVEIAEVGFHNLSPAEIDNYADTGEGVGCAGGYQLEGAGVRLICSLEGSHFTVLGLPMIPLLDALRRLEVG